MLKRRIRKTKSGSWHWECYICIHWGSQWTWDECLAELEYHNEHRCAGKNNKDTKICGQPIGNGSYCLRPAGTHSHY